MALSALGAIQQAGATTAQNEFAQRMSEINMRRAKIQEADALDRGANAADKYRTNVHRLVGTQKVNLATQGIDISSGSAADTITETEQLGAVDARNIETNAFREAMGFGTQADDYRANQLVNNAAAQSRVTTTLLGGALSAANIAREQWGMPSKTPTAPPPPPKT